MSDIAIKIENVSKEYRLGAIGGTTLREEMSRFADKLFHRTTANADFGKRFMALQDINLEVKKGERLGIIGHNGAGKSTLLKLLARVTAPTTGTISYNGRISSMLEVGTGFHRELTGRENIYMNGAILGMTKREIDSKIDAIIDFAEMKQFIDTPVKRYSSGMYVKLAFAVAAHLDSDIMIMDEVLAVGDVKFQQKCLGKMGELSQGEGRTVLFVSHNMGAIKRLCNRVVLMSHGNIIDSGEPTEIIDKYVYEGSSGMNSHVTFPVNKQKEAYISSIRMLDGNGVEKAAFDIKDTIVVEIEYEAMENISNSNLSLSVFKSGELLFRSWDTDDNPQIMQKRLKGHHRIRFTLDPILCDGTYTITLSMGHPNMGIIDRQSDCIIFTISHINVDGTSRGSTRGGVFVPKAHWNEII